MSVLIFGLQICAGVVVLGLLGAGMLVALAYIGGVEDDGVITDERT